MYTYIKWFLLLMIAYHVIHTVLLWGLGIGDQVIISSIKEFLWFGFVLFALIRRRKQARAFFVNWKWLVIGLVALIVWSVGLSYMKGVSMMTMVVGFKYDIVPLLIVVSAMFVGTLLIYFKDELLRKDILKLLTLVIVGGLLRQLLKINFPELFSYLGYGPVGDYTLASAPPLYYRTGPGGWMRLQGLFSGPNNYGFFLVAYCSVLLGILFGKNKSGISDKRTRRSLVALFVVSVIRTLSRGVLVGLGVQALLLIRLFRPQWKRRVGALVIGGVVAIGALSILKPASTLGHLSAWTEGIDAFAQQPLGHGLGSAGPAVHRDGIYLPENHYLQLLLDIGIPGLLLRIRVILGVIVCGRYGKISEASPEVKVRMLLIIGLLGLLVEGLFLHVFEDSMVNYLFLVVLGLVIGMQKTAEVK